MPLLSERLHRSLIFQVLGEFDATTASQVERTVAAALADIDRVILDCGRMTDVSAPALRVIALLAEALPKRGQTLYACPADLAVRDALISASLQLDIVFVPDIDTAIAAAPA